MLVLSRKTNERIVIGAGVETRMMIGSPGTAIVAVAEECQADMIVMGTPSIKRH